MHYDFIRTKEIMRNSAFYIANRIEFRFYGKADQKLTKS